MRNYKKKTGFIQKISGVFLFTFLVFTYIKKDFFEYTTWKIAQIYVSLLIFGLWNLYEYLNDEDYEN